jgi:hypothetical protein
MSVSISNTGPPLSSSTATSITSLDSSKNVEPLAVRVMRLSKPALYQNTPVYAEEEFSSTAAAFLTGQSHDIAIGNDHSVLSHLLVLPYSFGYIQFFLKSKFFIFMI